MSTLQMQFSHWHVRESTKQCSLQFVSELEKKQRQTNPIAKVYDSLSLLLSR